MSQLVWLITGCSPGGLGEFFVRSILARGDRVIATARSLTKIKSLESLGAATLQLNVTDDQHVINAKMAEAIKIYGRVDVLVNNAAYIAVGGWEDLKYSGRGCSEISTNVLSGSTTSVTSLTRMSLVAFERLALCCLISASDVPGLWSSLVRCLVGLVTPRWELTRVPSLLLKASSCVSVYETAAHFAKALSRAFTAKHPL
jgi:NAD(P)-dependent dehydrogenase (short-subunit alcohol dehydrogenase family)